MFTTFSKLGSAIHSIVSIDPTINPVPFPKLRKIFCFLRTWISRAVSLALIVPVYILYFIVKELFGLANQLHFTIDFCYRTGLALGLLLKAKIFVDLIFDRSFHKAFLFATFQHVMFLSVLDKTYEQDA